VRASRIHLQHTLTSMASFARAYRAGHQHVLPFATPANWIQHHSSIRAYSAAPHAHLYALQPARPVAAISYSAYGAGIESEHQQEGVASSCPASPIQRSFRSPQPSSFSARAEGEPVVQPKQRGWWEQMILAGKGRRQQQGWFGRMMSGAVACMVVISSAAEPEPAPRAAAAAAAPVVDAQAAQAEGIPFPPRHHAPPQAEAAGRGEPLPNPMKGLLPDLGSMQPIAPAVEFGLAAFAGYLTGCTARVVTRVGVLVIGVCGLGLYALQKQGLVELKMDHIRALGRRLLADQQQRVEDAANRNPAVVSKLGQVIETLTMTTHGVGFSVGFLWAFK
jgi:uncharacterized membrane protein (Fun14 family)